MANNLRDIRRKIKAVKSTRQVTKAMELVSASKMRRAVQNAQALRRYALTAWAMLRKLGKSNAGHHPFLTDRPVKKVLAVFFTSDRGLCGSFNAHLCRTANQYARSLESLSGHPEVEFIAVGRRGQQFLARTGRTVVAAFPALSNHPTFKDVLPVVKMAMDGFLKGDYDRVVLVYSDFISALVQEPAVKVLLPFSDTVLQDMMQSLFPKKTMSKEEVRALQLQDSAVEYTFEPSPQEVLERVLPQLTELQMYQAALESAASEHSARMVAMRNATENASDFLEDLNLTYNRTRQAIITAELAELSASKAALD